MRLYVDTDMVCPISLEALDLLYVSMARYRAALNLIRIGDLVRVMGLTDRRVVPPHHVYLTALHAATTEFRYWTRRYTALRKQQQRNSNTA